MLNKKFVKTELSIGSWNLNGVWQRINSFRYNKLKIPEIYNLISQKHIFGLIETHHKANEVGDLHLTDYKCFSICRPKDKILKNINHLEAWPYMEEFPEPQQKYVSGVENREVQRV